MLNKIQGQTWIQIAVTAIALLTGCIVQNRQPQSGELLGIWKTDPVQTEWGLSVLEVNFQDTTNVEFKMTPVGEGQSIISKGKYRLSGKQLTSEAINKGEPVLIWLEKDQLVIQIHSEKPQHFSRK